MKLGLIALLAVVCLGIGAAVVSGELSDGGAADGGWARQADRHCSQARYRLTQMPPIYFATYGKVVRRIAGIEHSLVQRLQELGVEGGDEHSIRRLVGLLGLQANNVDGAAAAYAGDTIHFAAHRQHVRAVRRLDGEIAAAARAAGSIACAQPPVPTQYL